MKLAWRRKTGAESDAGSSQLPGRVLQGAMTSSCNMLKGKSARRRSSIVGIIEGSCLKSFTTSWGIFSNGLILKMPELPSLDPSFATLPASHGKLADSRSRPVVNVLQIADFEEASVIGKQRHI